VLFAGWKMKKADFMDEITSGGEHRINPWYLKFIMFSVRYLAPVVIAVIMVRSLI
jgi:SNF family Na+-dependent transporter